MNQNPTTAPLRQQIYQALAQVPLGTVCTYGQLAKMAGLPGYARFVGTTLKQLPQDTQLPWHRVINSQGKISFPIDSEGYIRQRQRLLDEGIDVKGNKVSLKRFQWQVMS